jgi:CHAT domain-containing protein
LREYLLDVTQTNGVKKRSQQLYEWLIRPAEIDLASSGIKNLVFVLDGSLRNIPMAVLYDSKGQKYLVEKYALALTPGLQLVAPKPLRKVKLNALTAGVSEKRSVNGQEFAPLENVKLELSGIESVVSKSKKLLDREFTENNLQKQMKLADFSVVHLATHGEFSSNPEKTFILTWNQLLKVKDLDRLLQISAQNGSSTIELLVLSACKTAVGDKQAALGLAGVAVQAGARSTLATLWSVDDQSTSELMSQFYRELKTGVTKAQALQRAQLSVLKHEKRPFFWASYILLGNWL